VVRRAVLVREVRGEQEELVSDLDVIQRKLDWIRHYLRWIEVEEADRPSEGDWPGDLIPPTERAQP
jgi:hypothetical protein